MAHQYAFILFVAGNHIRTQRTHSQVEHILQQAVGAQYILTLVDVMTEPEVAEQYQILATPTLIRLQPTPHHQIIGDFSDAKMVCQAFDLPIPGL